jgi:hypothetical protein
VDFYSAVRDSQRDVKELLTESLSRFSTLTEAGGWGTQNGREVKRLNVKLPEPQVFLYLMIFDAWKGWILKY